MITLHLTRVNDDEGVYLQLPASPDEIREAFSELDAISTDAPTSIVDVACDVPNLYSYTYNTEVDAPGQLDKLQRLAERLEDMDTRQLKTFSGALDSESINSLDNVIEVAENIERYEILLDVTCDRELGGYLVENGIKPFYDEVRPYLDYARIGSEFYADHGGAYCPAGYVVRRSELPEQFLRTEPEQKQKSTILLRLRASHGGHQAATDTALTLPATDEALERTKQRLGISEFAEAQIVTVDYVFPYFATMMPQDCITVEDANELAQAIEQMSRTDGEMLKCLAALEAERPGTFQAALNIAIDLDDYERVPADKEEYGHMVLERLGADEAIINAIDGFMDYESFGAEWMREDGAVRTEFGHIRRLSAPFETQAMGGMEMR